jgi:hypothetical protein
MSAFTVVKTVLKDLTTVKKALINMGWKESQIELHDKPVSLNGYHGSGKREAHLVIRKSQLGGRAYNDIGFLKQKDGSIQAIVGDYSKSRGGSRGQHGHMEGMWLDTLNQEYAYVKLEDEMTAQGFFIDSVERRDGKIYVEASNPYTG